MAGNDDKLTQALTPHLAWFARYAGSLRPAEPRQAELFRLKYDHSLAVLDQARAIVAAMDAPRNPAWLLCLAALVHDVGRFPQLARYGTYVDAKSVDHGWLGVRALREQGAPHGLTPAQRRLVWGAVQLHNKRRLPTGLRPSLAEAAELVRDADKLDIMALTKRFMEGRHAYAAPLFERLIDHPDRYTPEVCQQVLAGQPADVALVRYRTDYVMLIAGWVHDLNLPAAAARLRASGDLEALLAQLPDLPEPRGLGQALRRELSRRCGQISY